MAGVVIRPRSLAHVPSVGCEPSTASGVDAKIRDRGVAFECQFVRSTREANRDFDSLSAWRGGESKTSRFMRFARGLDLAPVAVMKSSLIGTVFAGVVALSTSRSALGSPSEAERSSFVVVPKAEWASFVAALDHSLDRNVPEVRGKELVAIRYFYVRALPAERMGIASGDRFAAVNGVKVAGSAANASRFLHDEMSRSATTCALSFSIEAAGATHTVGARCGDR